VKKLTLGVALTAALSMVGTSAVLAQDDEAAEVVGNDTNEYALEPVSAADFGLVPLSADTASHDRAYWHEKADDWFALTPFSEHFGPQHDCQAAQEGPVFFLSNIPFGMFDIYDCVIESDKYVYVGIGGGFDFDDAPEATLEAMYDMALDNSFVVLDPFLIVDGQEIPVGGSNWYQGPARAIDLPEDNLFGVPPGTYNSAANGFSVMLEPLEPGRHTILVGDRTLQAAAKADNGVVSDPPERDFASRAAFVAFDIEVPGGEEAEQAQEAETSE
jgi:hypothetical protein